MGERITGTALQLAPELTAAGPREARLMRTVAELERDGDRWRLLVTWRETVALLVFSSHRMVAREWARSHHLSAGAWHHIARPDELQAWSGSLCVGVLLADWTASEHVVEAVGAARARGVECFEQAELERELARA